MGNGYTTVVPEGEELAAQFRDIYARLRELEALDGTQIYNTVQELRKLIDGLLEQVNGNFSGTLTVGGTATIGGSTTLNSTLFVPGAYNNNLTGSGGYRTAYWSLIGEAGYVPSSMQFKRDIEDANLNPDDVLAIRLVKYRYKDAVENLGEDAPTDVGVIAEDIHALGLDFLVDFDEEGKPFGFKYERLSVALLAAVQSLATRIEALEG